MRTKYQRRHYEDLARVLQATRETDPAAEPVIQKVEDRLIVLFIADNPNFDITRFEQAAKRRED